MMKLKQKMPVVQVVTASHASIDRDGLVDLVLEIDRKIVPLLAEQTENGVKYRPIAASDIYHIR